MFVVLSTLFDLLGKKILFGFIQEFCYLERCVHENLRASSLVLRHSLSALRFSRSCHGIPMSTRWYSVKNAQFFSSRLHAFHTYMNHSVVVVTDINIFSIYEKVFSSLCASVFQRTLLEWKNVHKKSFHVHQISKGHAQKVSP